MCVFQFSLLNKREGAHSEGIWACAWGHYIPKETSPKDPEKENNEEDKENQDASDKADENLPEV